MRQIVSSAVEYSMSDDFMATAKHMLQSACDLQGQAIQAREQVRGRYRVRESNEQNVLRIAADGLVGAVARRLDQPINDVNAESSYQIGLSASFIRTYFLVTDLLLNGDLIEGLVLLRKQIEVLARILELEKSAVEELRGKTPNVKHLLTNGTGRIYGRLSEVAHFSTPECTELMGVNVDGSRKGPSLVPQFQEAQFEQMALLHFTGIRFSQWMLRKLVAWYPTADFKLEREIALQAITAAINAGVLAKQELPNA